MIKTLEELLFPDIPKCMFCGTEREVDQARRVCPACQKELDHAKSGAKFQISGMRCRAVYEDEGLAALGVRRLKFEGERFRARFMAEEMKRLLGSLEAFDVITAVPLHRRRLAQRGFNQAELLARELDTYKYARLLRKTRHTKTQSLLDADERRKNVTGAYAAGERALGASILLIDDVCTTGSTLLACAEALYEAGAKSVEACVYAATPKNIF